MKKKQLLAVGLALVLTFGGLLALNDSAEAFWIFSSDDDLEVEEGTEVEIFSWWTGGGEEEGLEALFDHFRDEYPEVEIVNSAVAGGAGANAKAVLQTRMIGGNPPDSFQVHGGPELIEDYVKPGMMQPLDELLEEWGYLDEFHPDILEMVSHEGNIYSIPLNVHRSNVLWYNVELLNEANVEPPTDLDSFIYALEAIEAETDYTPLALGDVNRWTATHLFEAILAAELGAEEYNGLWERTTDFSAPEVREALVKFDTILDYVNDDHAALSWQEASERVADNQAVFNVMGDWAEGYFRTLGLEPNEDYGWTVLPEDNFMVITDTFGLPEGAPNPAGARAWLKTVASRSGQDVFNPIKGSIPSRLDAEEENYGPYLQSSMEDFETDTLTPSIAHGSAAPSGFMSELNDIINQFVSERDVDDTWDNIQTAADEYIE